VADFDAHVDAVVVQMKVHPRSSAWAMHGDWNGRMVATEAAIAPVAADGNASVVACFPRRAAVVHSASFAAAAAAAAAGGGVAIATQNDVESDEVERIVLEAVTTVVLPLLHASKVSMAVVVVLADPAALIDRAAPLLAR
jgi:hypothetical protein